jgi:gamma-glutamyltranspeptidase/glutathione hydrolase
MVVADDRQAAEWGSEILRQGGNAVDAAVATAFAMSVTRPHLAALGGGGFLLFCPAHSKNCHIIDYREKAPPAASRDMYVRDGKVRSDLSRVGPLASGVPGVTAGLLTALEKFGSLPRQKILSRPIELARNGIVFSTNTEKAAAPIWKHMNEEAKQVFGCGKTDSSCTVGQQLKQPDLARVLESISKEGKKGFYEGWVARKIVDGIRNAGGIFTMEDLANYSAAERTPLQGRFAGMEIVTMPPPSSGGIALLQLLSYLERADRDGRLDQGYGSIPALHATAHAMTLAFADRAEYLGDPDFVKVPQQALLDQKYLDSRWQTFNSCKADFPPPGNSTDTEHLHTTHFSVIDREGNAVAITTTVNELFGSGFVPPGTGVVMNNEMDDFSASPGAPNLFGLVGSEANSIAPGKRPLSSMSPTIVRDSQGRNRIVVGAQGGPRIITSVFHTLLNRLRYGMSLPDAVAAARFHEQWKPTTLKIERFGFPHETLSALKKMGYTIEEVGHLGIVHALERFENGRTWGAPDPRSEGAAVAE